MADGNETPRVEDTVPSKPIHRGRSVEPHAPRLPTYWQCRRILQAVGELQDLVRHLEHREVEHAQPLSRLLSRRPHWWSFRAEAPPVGHHTFLIEQRIKRLVLPIVINFKDAGVNTTVERDVPLLIIGKGPTTKVQKLDIIYNYLDLRRREQHTPQWQFMFEFLIETLDMVQVCTRRINIGRAASYLVSGTGARGSFRSLYTC